MKTRCDRYENTAAVEEPSLLSCNEKHRRFVGVCENSVGTLSIIQNRRRNQVTSCVAPARSRIDIPSTYTVPDRYPCGDRVVPAPSISIVGIAPNHLRRWQPPHRLRSHLLARQPSTPHPCGNVRPSSGVFCPASASSNQSLRFNPKSLDPGITGTASQCGTVLFTYFSIC
jgi:hypothetical protein